MIDPTSFVLGAAAMLAMLCVGVWMWFHFWPFDPDGVKALAKRRRIAKRAKAFQ